MVARTPIPALLSYLAGRPEAVDTTAWSAAEWDALVEAAEQREVESLLYERIRSTTPPPRIPPPILRRLAELYCITALRNRRAYTELGAALTALRADGVEVIVLKGAYLAPHVYGDVALRVMGDFDLLVPTSALGAAERALLALGYAPQREATVEETIASAHHRPPLRKPGCTPIELHWTIEGPGTPFRVDRDGLWERSRPVEIAGVSVRRLSADDLVVHLCVHAAYHHRWGKEQLREVALRPICDIALAIERLGEELDWGALVEIAGEAGMGRYVYSALAVARRLLGAAVPPAALEELRPSASDRAVVGAVAELLGAATTVEVPVAYRQWVRGGRVADRLRALAASIFPGRERLREMYGLPPGSARVYPYYLVRPLDLIRRRGWTLARLAVRSEGRSLAAQERSRLRIAAWLDE